MSTTPSECGTLLRAADPLTRRRRSYVTQNGTDVISHRIDYTAPGADGSILYGDFQVQHDLESFRKTFTVPDECKKPNTLRCGSEMVARVNKLRPFH